MLDVVRLAEFANRKPSQLSGGQQQRVALARALVNFPSALLLDEPLAALDLKLREAMQFELKRIQREVGITFVFVTHDQGEALTMSDRIAVMSEGVSSRSARPQEIYNSPASPVRRRVHRLGQPAAGRRSPATTATTSSSSSSAAPTVRATPGRHPANGDPVSVMLRPERLQRLRRRRDRTDDPSRGSSADVVFQGATARLQLELADGTEIVAVRRSGRRPAVPAPGHVRPPRRGARAPPSSSPAGRCARRDRHRHRQSKPDRRMRHLSTRRRPPMHDSDRRTAAPSHPG